VRSWAFHSSLNSPNASCRTQASVGAAAILCGIAIGGNGDGGDPGVGAVGVAGVIVLTGGTKSVHRRRKMYSGLPGVHHALPEAALPR
jgi:hypothetical protein